jgi:hypothetical protein
MPVLKLAAGMVVAIYGFKMEIVMGIKEAANQTIAYCAANPDQVFLRVYLGQFKLKPESR